MLFEQMKAHEGKLKEAKDILDSAIKEKADADLDNNNLLDDGTNSCISKMLLVLTALIAHSEGLTSSIIDMASAKQDQNKGKKILTPEQARQRLMTVRQPPPHSLNAAGPVQSPKKKL